MFAHNLVKTGLSYASQPGVGSGKIEGVMVSTTPFMLVLTDRMLLELIKY